MKQIRMARIIDDYESLQKQIGHRLQMMRIELGLNQTELAEACGVSNGRISENEAGNALISTDLILALWQVFHVSPFYLLFDIGPRRFARDPMTDGAGVATLNRLLEAISATSEWLLSNGGEVLPQPAPEDMNRFSNARFGKTAKAETYTAEEVAELMNQLRKKERKGP